MTLPYKGRALNANLTFRKKQPAAQAAGCGYVS